MQNTHDLDRLTLALIDLFGFLNSPRRDDALLREAGVRLDRALFALLVMLDAKGPLSVAELADQVGRDHTTVSRQLAKLEALRLVEADEDVSDRRRHASRLTRAGRRIVRAIGRARRRLLSKVLAAWSAADRAALAKLTRRFADDLIRFARERS